MDDATRAAWRAADQVEVARRSRSSGLLIAVVALAIVPAWAGFDVALEPSQAHAFVVLRLACELPMALCAWLLWRHPIGRRRPELPTVLSLAVVQGEISWMVVRASDARDFYVLGFSLALYASGCLMGGQPRWTAAVVGATWLSLAVALWTAPHALSARDLTATAFYLSTASVIGMVAHLQRHRLTGRELVTRAELLQEQRRTEQLLTRLERLSYQDALTGLANRRRWDQELAAASARSRRTLRPLAIILIDVDRFKRINDRYGHRAGDSTLCDVAALLTGRARAGELVARIGGDEYGVLLPDTDVAGAVELAEQLRQGADGRGTSSSVPFSLSLGVAADAGTSADPELLMSRADKQLYRAKETRNAVAPAHLSLTPDSIPQPRIH